MSERLSMHRRELLIAGAGLIAFAHQPTLAMTGNRDPRLLMIFLRGGLDGLDAVPATGDPAFASARQYPVTTLPPAPIALDGIFGLNPAMPKLAALYRAKQALIVHATASPYRSRSHFAAQDVMESGIWPVSGGGGLGGTGWLNRAMQALPKGEPVSRSGLAVAPTIPLMMQGSAAVETFQQQRFGYADDDVIARLSKLYEARDPVLATALRGGVDLDTMTRADPMAKLQHAPGRPDFVTNCASAAKLMARADGPRIGMINLDGWDTHVGEVVRLSKYLASLDDAIEAMRTGFGPAWRDTAIMIITEFGRTVRINGGAGSDHGNGTVAFLVGGAVRGGRIIADWPGLRSEQLLEARDLKPTTDIRRIFKGVLADHLGIGLQTLGSRVFPGTPDVLPMPELIV